MSVCLSQAPHLFVERLVRVRVIFYFVEVDLQRGEDRIVEADVDPSQGKGEGVALVSLGVGGRGACQGRARGLWARAGGEEESVGGGWGNGLLKPTSTAMAMSVLLLWA
jgi:hypothetical protein